MAAADVRNGMPDRQNAAGKRSPEMVGIDDGGERVLMPSDPFANARAWLAAMESSMRRASQQAAPQLVQVDPETPMPIELVEQYLPTLLVA